VRRLVPDGLAARMMLLLAAALGAALAVALVALAAQREFAGREARLEGELTRLLALVPVIDAAPPAERERIARRASARGGLRLAAEPSVDAAPDPRASALAARLSAALGGREVRVGPRGRGPGLAVAVALSEPPAWIEAELRGRPPRADPGDLLPWLVLLTFAAVLGAGLGIARQIARPLAHLEDAARAAGRGDRAARAPEDGPRELRRAARAFNDMQARIARADAERARVMGALGHDLRTPITSLRIRAEMLPEADAAPMIRTLDEMTVMADGLMAHARSEADPEVPEPVALAPFLRELAEARGAETAALAPASAAIRPVALGRAVGNLIDNALRYAGAARVSLTREDGAAVIAVDDDGPGIAPERLRDVQEPFVRGEASRQPGSGGVGLGLSIARAVARTHGGELRLANRAEGGLRAEIRLPAL
jgi:signal transduction histidine kinase